ncbi:conserved hypothetical protein [Formosa agariphila KMM 3901]|uniref:Uncharacterized protein n=1 Tax=Formosa agariphila (strain DSM 15362 / KCTC 12365 / LMG 23005 / KMM 3901 / M-2Alg 35-1) TaxID=1347342 RepID=T2KMF5_FORAG|nr:hypothetical protein [Formosa agariphila]CDF79643.1 conserved hypothetical protein [Formosa agariphila KMM 3901]
MRYSIELKRKVIFLAVFLLSISFCNAQDIPKVAFKNQKDYSFMWWEKTIKTGNKIFAIKTNRYRLEFDYPNLSINDFSNHKDLTSENIVLRETNAESFPSKEPITFSFGVKRDGVMNWCQETSGTDDDCQLIETGKYFQRRFITNLPDLKGVISNNSGLEISSWPDRISFILKTVPSTNLKNIELHTKLTFPSEYNTIIVEGEVKALKNPKNGSGYIFLKSSQSNRIVVKGTTVEVTLSKQEFYQGVEENSGIIIYPVSEDIDKKIVEISNQENQPVVIIANQVAPIEKSLDVNYNQDKGWHEITLRSDKIKSESSPAEPGEGNPGPQDRNNERMEQVQFTITNSSDVEKVARLSFAKGRIFDNGADVFAIPGISAVLRDMEGNPIGIPIQLSKNWHTEGRTGVDDDYFRGSWYHGLTMLTVPANTTLNLEYTSVNSLWGGVPAASHAQLCLVGWGHNQQWDESAIGAWGETITYEPDLDQTGAPVLDFRPLLVSTPKDKKWGWTGNLGGADFFDYTKLDGNRGWHSRIRTQYKRYSPNFTEVTYAGTMDDNAMDFEYQASIGRSDDITRGIYKIKLKVLKDVTFKDFSIIEFASSRYHHVKSKDLAWGNETGVKRQWQSTVGGVPRYTTEKSAAEGEFIWFSFNDSEYTSPQLKRFRLAERGFVVRDWKAKINGDTNVSPWFAEYNTASGDYGDQSAIIKIVPPKNCTSFKAGDFIEATVELILIPSALDDYYGPNKNLKNALRNNALTWELIYREALGNDLAVDVTKGELVDNYPIKIRTENNKAQFSVIGGIGYVPLTLTNVGSYKKPFLFVKEDSKWKKVNQEVHGNDFWQTEFNAENETWDVTFNVNLDSPNDMRQKTEFKFVGIPN